MNCTNKFLVALPSIRDQIFKKTVIYINDHNQQGASGFIANKPLGESMSKSVLKKLGIERDAPVFYGGPVEINNAAFVHTSDMVNANSLPLSNGLYLTRDKRFVDIVNSEQCPRNWKLVIGFSSWAPNQLEFEMSTNFKNGTSNWAVTDYSDQLFWNFDHVQMWDEAMKRYAEDLTKQALGVMSHD